MKKKSLLYHCVVVKDGNDGQINLQPITENEKIPSLVIDVVDGALVQTGSLSREDFEKQLLELFNNL